MGLYKPFGGMYDYVNRMKEEADKKEEEERRRKEKESLEQWRRSQPIGPPTQAQATLGDFTKPVTSSGSMAPSGSRQQTSSGSLAPSGSRSTSSEGSIAPSGSRTKVQTPSYEVTKPRVDTGVPSIGASGTYAPSVSAQVTQPVAPAWEAPVEPEREREDPLAQWRMPLAPKNTGIVQPLAPQALGAVLPPLLQQGVQGVQDFLGNFLPDTAQQGLQMSSDLVKGWVESNPMTAGFSIALTPVYNMGVEGTPENMALQVRRQQIEQRADERAANSLTQGNIRKGLGHVGTAISNVFELLQLTTDLAAVQKLPNGQTLGQTYAIARETGELTPAVNGEFLGIPYTTAIADQRKYPFGFVVAALSRPDEIAEYWDAATKNILAATVPDETQRAAGTKAVRDAHNLALVLASSGRKAMESVFDAKLNFPQEAARLTEEVRRLAEMGDQMAGNPQEQKSIWAEAGRKSAQAVLLRETNVADLYNQFYDPWYALPYEFVVDPLNLVDVGTDLFKVGTAMRRYRQGQALAVANTAISPGFDRRFVDSIKDNPIMEWMKLNMSKAKVDTNVNYSVLTNLLSGFSAKGDLIQVLGGYIAGTLKQGIDASTILSPEALATASDGIIHLGWAGIDSWAAQKARKSVEGLAGWVASLPSLQGEADEIANKVEVMGDLIGMLTRGSAIRHNVSEVGNVPWGTASMVVTPTSINKARVDFLDEAGELISSSEEMLLNRANKMAKNITRAIATGKEFKTNYVKAVGDFRRNILSAFTINTPQGLITNALGGQLTSIMDRGFSGEYFNKLENQVDYLAIKFGGLLPEVRLTEGVGKIRPSAKVSFGAEASETGFGNAQGFERRLSQIINWATLGTSTPIRKLRQGATEVPGTGIKVGEEAMAFSVYVSAFRDFAEKELPKRLGPEIAKLLQENGVADMQTVKHITDQIVQAAISGGRTDVARAFQDIANGKIGLSLRSLSPAFHRAFTDAQAVEVDTLLRNLSPDNLQATSRRISEIIAAQRHNLYREVATQSTVADRNFFTTMDDLRDKADVVEQYRAMAQQLGKNVDEAQAMGEQVGALFETINEGMLQLLQMAQQTPNAAGYVYNVWGQIRHLRDVTRANIGLMADTVREATQHMGVDPMRVTRGTRNDAYALGFRTQIPTGRIDPIFGPQGTDLGLRGMKRVFGENQPVPGTKHIPADIYKSIQQTFQIGEERMQGIAKMLDARAEMWASYFPDKSPVEWFNETFLAVERTRDPKNQFLAAVRSYGSELKPNTLFAHQVMLAEEQWTKMERVGRELRPVLAKMTEDDRLYVLVHELGHIFRDDLAHMAQTIPAARREWEYAKRWSGIKGDEIWPGEAEERFAEAFVLYARNGIGPNPQMTNVFQRFKKWLKGVGGALVMRVRDMTYGLDENIDHTFDFLFKVAKDPEPFSPKAMDYVERLFQDFMGKGIPPFWRKGDPLPGSMSFETYYDDHWEEFFHWFKGRAPERNEVEAYLNSLGQMGQAPFAAQTARAERARKRLELRMQRAAKAGQLPDTINLVKLMEETTGYELDARLLNMASDMLIEASKFADEAESQAVLFKLLEGWKKWFTATMETSQSSTDFIKYLRESAQAVLKGGHATVWPEPVADLTGLKQVSIPNPGAATAMTSSDGYKLEKLGQTGNYSNWVIRRPDGRAMTSPFYRTDEAIAWLRKRGQGKAADEFAQQIETERKYVTGELQRPEVTRTTAPTTQATGPTGQELKDRYGNILAGASTTDEAGDTVIGGTGVLNAPVDAIVQTTVEEVQQAAAALGTMPQQLRQQMQKTFGLSDEQTGGLSALMEARAKYWAQLTGRTADEWFQQIGAFEVKNDKHMQGILAGFRFWEAKGKPSILAASPDLAKRSEADRLAVLAHELGHMFHKDMYDASKYSAQAKADWELARKVFGFEDSYSVKASAAEKLAREKFADSFVSYLRSGKAPIPELQGFFERFKEWIKSISLVIKAAMDPNIVARKKARPVYDTLFGAGQQIPPGSTTPPPAAAGAVPPPAAAAPPPAAAGAIPPAGGAPPPGAATPPPAAAGPNPQTQQAWSDFYQQQDAVWKEFGRRAVEIMENARTNLLNKTWANEHATLRQQLEEVEAALDPTQLRFGLNELLSDLSVDPDVAHEYIKQKLGWASKDPNWNPAIISYRKLADKYQAEMFVALSRYPNQTSYDEFMSAIRNVSHERRKVTGALKKITDKLNDPEVKANPAERAKWFKALQDSQNSLWGRYWKYTWDRYQTAAHLIYENNIRIRNMETLSFQRPNSQGDWLLLGPDLRNPGKWVAKAPDGRRADNIPSGGKIGVPLEVLDRYKQVQKLAQGEANEQMARIAAQIRQSGGDEAMVDALMQQAGQGTPDMVNQIRQGVQKWMASWENPTHNLLDDMPNHYNDLLDNAEQALGEALPKIAQTNAQGYGRMGMNTMAEFNRRILPLFDNILEGGKKVGREAVSFSLIDYTNLYHPDVLLGLYAPFHYWFTRQGKNVVERMIFHPGMSSAISKYMRAVRVENRSENQPARNIDSLPGGIQVGDTEYRTSAALPARWIPTLPTYFMNGWADPQRANRSYDYARSAYEQQAWPAKARGTVADMVYLNELAKEFGFSPHPDIDAAVGMYAGEQPNMKGWLGQTSSLHRTLGWGAVTFTNWAMENGIDLGWGQPALESYMSAAVPDYEQYLYGREASFQARRGNLSDQQAGMVQDLAYQDQTGAAPMPEQNLIAPEAQQQYRDVQQKVAWEYFVRGLITYLTSAPTSAVYEPEMELRKAQEQQRLMGYDRTRNPAGSMAARYSMTDPESANYERGLEPFNQQYTVMGESQPYVEGEVERPGQKAVSDAYYADRQRIFDKYQQEQEAAYAAHPDWNQALGAGSKEREAYDDEWNDRRKAELDALAAKYPTITTADKKEKTKYSLYGARPQETLVAAQQRLLDQAEANMAHLKPEEGSKDSVGWQAYNAAVEGELARLMNTPGAPEAAVFGRTMSRVGVRPGDEPENLVSEGSLGTSGSRSRPEPTKTPIPPYQGAVTPQGNGTFEVQQPQTVTPHPDNKWFAEMAAAEQEYNLPPGLLQAVAAHESNFKPDASSGAAHGLMQFTPGTWAGLPASLGVTDIWDPEDSIKAAAFYLNQINEGLPADKKDNVAWIVAGYNIGPGAVAGMTDLKDIVTYSQKQGYKDAQARYQYALDIAAEVGGQAASQQVVATVPATGQTFIRPVAGGSELVSQGYGANVEGYREWNDEYGHEGIDYGVAVGTPVLAAAGGKVVFAGEGGGFANYGKYVVIQHQDGYKSYYAHLSDFDAKVGDTVAQGQVIAKSGYSGRVQPPGPDGAHLHFALQKEGADHPYGMVDPTDFILGRKNLGTQTASAPPAVAPATQPQVAAKAQPSTAPSTVPSVMPAGQGDIAWTGSAADIIQQNKTFGQGPNKRAAEEQVAAEWNQINTRGRETYPEWGHLYDQYRSVPVEQREAWKQANPMIYAINLVAYNPKEWEYVENTFGKGVVQEWAMLSRGEDVGDANVQVYRRNPNVFLAKAWISGRPEPYQARLDDIEQAIPRDFGTDYETAKEMFGADIWEVVKKYYTIPQYVKGGDNTEWLAFKEQYPQYDQWREWWYALISDQKASTASGFQPWGGFSGGWDSGGSPTSRIPDIQMPALQRGDPPAWREPAGGSGDWRKWLALGEVNLKSWRR